jgi:negative regulator of flagellin synthesis FlgM
MKINGNSPLPLDPAPAGKGRAAKAETAEGSTAAPITGVATQLSSLETQMGDGGFDAAKVEAIKSAIRDGRFQVNAEVVADKLIASVRELVGK